MSKKKQAIIGITGYLGSGKSTALEYFEKFGFYSIDADKIVHDLYEPGKDGWSKIKDFFGEEYLIKGKGKVNRPKLRKVVFNNINKLKILEKLVQPIVFNEIRKRVQKSKSKRIAIESTTFDKTRIGMEVTHILWIDSSITNCYKRCSKKRSITRQEHRNIVAHQKKPKKIDSIIKNNGTKAEFKKKVEKIAKSTVLN